MKNKAKSLSSLIKSCAFDWVDSDITDDNFPMQEQAKVTDLEVLHFNRDISSESALEEIEKQGLRPANIYELLVYAKKNPQEQLEYPIVALGSVWWDAIGHRYVACLREGSNGRHLSLGWFAEGNLYKIGWLWYYRFLAVRKSGTRKLGNPEPGRGNLENWPFDEIVINGIKYRREG